MHRTRIILLFIAIVSLCTLFLVLKVYNSNSKAQSVHAEGTESEQNVPPSVFISNEILIKIKKEHRGKVNEKRLSDVGVGSLNEKLKKHKVNKFEKVARRSKNAKEDAEIFAWYKITLDEPGERVKGNYNRMTKTVNSDNKKVAELSKALNDFSNDSVVEVAQPNFIMQTTLFPNDPYYASTGSWGQTYPDLWGIKKINSEAAWDQTTGSGSLIVADIDTGVDRNHEDLKANMWVNSGEVQGNGVDDEGNGYVDDYHGWDFVNNDNDPMDDHGHGTHVAGTIAGVGNNALGIVGVSWTSRIMALKFLSSNGGGPESAAAQALQYAADMGAKISSNSYGCNCQSLIMEDAIKYEHDRGMVAVVAAGNNNLDALDYSPASSSYAITVAASDPNDVKASFSNWGEKIDVSAPGVDILSARAVTNPMCTPERTLGSSYCRVSGTSMATPHVSGLVALILSRDPSLTNEEVRQIIRGGSVDLGNAGKDQYFGYGRIDSAGSLTQSATKPLAPIITSPSSRSIVGGSISITGNASGTNFASYKIEVGYGRAPTSWTEVAYSQTPVANGALATVNTATLKDGPAIFRISATDTSGKTFQQQVYDVEIDNIDAEITLPALLVPKGLVKVIGTAGTKNGVVFSRYILQQLDENGYFPTTAGITLSNNGLSPVINGELGTWDTSNLTDGKKYHIRLTVYTNGSSAQIMQPVIVDKDLVVGWPQTVETVYDIGYYHFITPAVADLDGDGNKEVVIAEPAGRIKVVKKDGSRFPGFPVTIDPGYKFNDPVNVVDLDGDGKKEIIATGVNSSNEAKIYIRRSDGTSYPGWLNPSFYSGYLNNDSSPSVADLNLDGKKDMVFTDSNGNIHALNLNGTELAGFPKKVLNNNHYGGAVSIADLDGDGKPEIAVTSSNVSDGTANKIYLLDNTGAVLPGWPYSPVYDGQKVHFESALASGDVNGDGKLEVIALGAQKLCESKEHPGTLSPNCPGMVYVLSKTATLFAGTPVVEGSLITAQTRLNSPAVADIDSDGKDEIMVGTYGTRVYGWVNNAVAKKFDDTSGGTSINAPAVADVDGDGKLELASVYNYRLRIVDDNGVASWQKDYPYNTVPMNVYKFLSPAMLSDLDNDGRMEFVAVHNLARETSQTNSYAYVWELPQGASPAKFEWPMFLQNPARGGRLTTRIAPSPTSTPMLTPTPTPTPTPLSDTLKPSVAITSPLNGSYVARGSTTTITVNASDASGILRVEFLVNNVLKCTDSTTTYTCSWSVPSKRGVTYSISAKAYDAAGNTNMHTIQVTSR